jgi:ABC-type nickel/cobalt efflux system permease component RcnA
MRDWKRPVFVLLLLGSWLLPSGADAHPVPRDNHDRTLLVRLTPEGVVVDYRLEVDEWRAAQDLPRSQLAGLESRRDLYTRYTKYHAPLLANALSARLDGRELEFICSAHHFIILDHIRCDFTFRAPWPNGGRLQPGREHAFDFREGNYELDDISALRLRLVVEDRLTAEGIQAPSEELMQRPPEARKPGDGERLRRLAARLQATPQLALGIARPALEPEMPPARPGASGRARKLAGVGKDRPEGVLVVTRRLPPPPLEVASAEPSPPESPREGSAGAGKDPDHSLLALLLDSNQGLAMALILSALFGGAHALTPGHGKTLAAAYLVGQRGTIGHALLLGVSTTLSHTWAVVAVAVLLLFFPGIQGAVQVLLGLVGGLLIAGLGVWILLRRVGGQADHVHLFSTHSHGEHGEVILHERPGWWGVIVLGIAGGMVPCTDAVLVLLFATGSGRLALALPLVLAFSVGLAVVLVIVGISVVQARNLVGKRWGGGGRLERWAQALPVLSALVITGVGLWMCFASVAGVR